MSHFNNSTVHIEKPDYFAYDSTSEKIIDEDYTIKGEVEAHREADLYDSTAFDGLINRGEELSKVLEWYHDNIFVYFQFEYKDSLRIAYEQEKQREEEQERKKHEEEEQKEIDRLKDMEPSIGMTKREVEMTSWGSPLRKSITEYENHITEMWVYGNDRFVHFDDGKVVSVTK